MLRLEPIIELPPFQLGPGTPARQPEEPFDAHWSRALAHAGVTGIAPRGAWHAALDDLVTAAAIELVLDMHFDRHRSRCVPEHYHPDGSIHDMVLAASPSEVADLVGPLEGGYELTCDGASLSFPGCCGDLADLEEWEKVATAPTEELSMLWIGHPWHMVRLRDGLLEIHAASESSCSPLIGRLDLPELRLAVRQAKDALGRFAERVAPVVRARFGDRKTANVVRAMIRR